MAFHLFCNILQPFCVFPTGLILSFTSRRVKKQNLCFLDAAILPSLNPRRLITSVSRGGVGEKWRQRKVVKSCQNSSSPASPPLFREVRQHMFCLTECSGQTSIYNLFISYPRSYHFMFFLYLESDTVRQQASMPGLSIILAILPWVSVLQGPGWGICYLICYFDIFFCSIMFILYFWERQHWVN